MMRINKFHYLFVLVSIVLIITGTSTPVEAGDIIPCPPETEMSLQADQGEGFKILNIKTPSL